MACGNSCPYYPGKRYEDWKLEDPAGKGVAEVRPVRDEIRTRIEELIGSLPPASHSTFQSKVEEAERTRD